MAIHDILCEVEDVREADTSICEFNGLLEDYLSTIETTEGKEDDYTILSQLFGGDHNPKICANLRLNINKDAIANQIIRYKGSFKLPKGTIKCPYVIYGSSDEHQKATILILEGKEKYVMTKALYYVMNEPENEYKEAQSEIIISSANMKSVDTPLDTVESLFERNHKAGIVQKELNVKLLLNYGEMYEPVQKIASYQLANLRDILAKYDDKEECINNIIVNWFLLKKSSYVRYMMNKNDLNRMYEENVKKQRQVAREKCGTIGFISYSELWKLVKELR